jgi:hypothetical protein
MEAIELVRRIAGEGEKTACDDRDFWCVYCYGSMTVNNGIDHEDGCIYIEACKIVENTST